MNEGDGVVILTVEVVDGDLERETTVLFETMAAGGDAKAGAGIIG